MTDTTTQEITLAAAERALAIHEIEKVFAARLRIMDTKQWDLYGSVHTEDVVSDTFGARAGDDASQRPGSVVGQEALTKAIVRVLDGAVSVTSVHHGHTPEITLTSDTTATGVWAMEDMLWWSHGSGEEHLHGYGHYHEKYRKVDGRWLIAYRNLTRLRVDQTLDSSITPSDSPIEFGAAFTTTGEHIMQISLAAGDVAALVGAWWYHYDEWDTDSLRALMTDDIAFRCASDTGATDYETSFESTYAVPTQ